MLLGSTEYSTPIDMWGVGCIFYEMACGRPLFPGSTVEDELHLIFKVLAQIGMVKRIVRINSEGGKSVYLYMRSSLFLLKKGNSAIKIEGGGRRVNTRNLPEMLKSSLK